ncbi:MAG: hypothetical protein U0W24_08500 [Bacteroidales bacterium]
MKKILLILIFAFNLNALNCQIQTDLNNLKEVEIYIFKTECRNEKSYNNFKTEAEQKEFSKKYQNVSDIPQNLCVNYIDLENCEVNETPLLDKYDIDRFDWTSSKIYLTQSGIKKIKELKVPLKGLPFVIKLNGVIIYGAWLWNMVSSYGCDRVWTFQDPIKNELKLEFGLGGFKCGTDPRKDESLIRKAIEKK